MSHGGEVPEISVLVPSHGSSERLARLLGDLDLDGDQDLVLLSAGADGRIGHRLLMNDGTGRFDPPVAFGGERNAPDARGAVAVDFGGDGALELLVSRAGARPELWHAPAPEGRHWLQVIPAKGAGTDAVSIEPTADGLFVETPDMDVMHILYDIYDRHLPNDVRDVYIGWCTVHQDVGALPQEFVDLVENEDGDGNRDDGVDEGPVVADDQQRGNDDARGRGGVRYYVQVSGPHVQTLPCISVEDESRRQVRGKPHACHDQHESTANRLGVERALNTLFDQNQ